jgi:hypothetical protein
VLGILGDAGKAGLHRLLMHAQQRHDLLARLHHAAAEALALRQPPRHLRL